MKKVAVIGSGSWGTALAQMLTVHGHTVRMWARNASTVAEINERHTNEKYLPGILLPQALTATTDRAEALEGADMILSAVPSRAVRQTMMDFASYVPAKTVVINVAKGLEDGSLLRLSEVIQQCVPQCEVCTLSGPSHAEEVAREIPTICLIASQKEEIAKMVQQEFKNPRF